MGVRHLRQTGQGRLAGLGDMRKGPSLLSCNLRHGRALALGIGLSPDGLDFLQRVDPLGPSRDLGHSAGVVKDGVEIEFAHDGLGHQ